jgi:hypothetical protein
VGENLVSLDERFDRMAPGDNGGRPTVPIKRWGHTFREFVGKTKGSLVPVSDPMSPRKSDRLGDEGRPWAPWVGRLWQGASGGFFEKMGEGDVNDVVFDGGWEGGEPARFAREALGPAGRSRPLVRFEEGFEGGHLSDDGIFVFAGLVGFHRLPSRTPRPRRQASLDKGEAGALPRTSLPLSFLGEGARGSVVLRGTTLEPGEM